MTDRGIIKWQPFNSCFSSASVLNEVNKEKNKVAFPELSEDQFLKIESEIRSALELRMPVNVIYYYDGQKIAYHGFVNAIDFQEKKIYLNKKCVYFKQILDINH